MRFRKMDILRPKNVPCEPWKANASDSGYLQKSLNRSSRRPASLSGYGTGIAVPGLLRIGGAEILVMVASGVISDGCRLGERIIANALIDSGDWVA